MDSCLLDALDEIRTDACPANPPNDFPRLEAGLLELEQGRQSDFIPFNALYLGNLNDFAGTIGQAPLHDYQIYDGGDEFTESFV
jgi:hypothetical protein